MATGRLPDPNSSPLTAKGDLYTYSTVPAKLAVGSDGETLVADSSATTGLRYNPQNALANPIINGGMDIWQRGTSTSTSQTFAADRWQVYLGTGNGTWSRQSVGDSTNLPNIQYCLRAQRNSGQTTTSILYAFTNLESVNSILFAGKTVTLSFYARAGANFSSSGNALGMTMRTGTGTDQNAWITGYTGQADTLVLTATLTTSWQRFVVTGTIPATTTEMSPAFFYTPSGTAGANDYFEVTGVQIDLGTYTASSAPTFRRSGGTLAGELAACQRYYYRITDSGDFIGGVGSAYSTTSVEAPIVFPVTMRTTPTTLDVSNVAVTDNVANYTGGTTTLNSANEQMGKLRYVHGSAALTQYRVYFPYFTGSGYVGFGAEL